MAKLDQNTINQVKKTNHDMLNQIKGIVDEDYIEEIAEGLETPSKKANSPHIHVYPTEEVARLAHEQDVRMGRTKIAERKANKKALTQKYEANKKARAKRNHQQAKYKKEQLAATIAEENNLALER